MYNEWLKTQKPNMSHETSFSQNSIFEWFFEIRLVWTSVMSGCLERCRAGGGEIQEVERITRLGWMCQMWQAKIQSKKQDNHKNVNL